MSYYKCFLTERYTWFLEGASLYYKSKLNGERDFCGDSAKRMRRRGYASSTSIISIVSSSLVLRAGTSIIILGLHSSGVVCSRPIRLVGTQTGRLVTAAVIQYLYISHLS